MNTMLPHHAHRPIGHPDILDAIIDVCEESKSYGMISLLAAISKHHHSAVQPRLRRIRKRIVLHLDDFAWRDKENDPHVEVIECTRTSPPPVALNSGDPNKIQARIEALQQRLKPTTIFFRGQLHESLLQVWKYLFPTVTLLICCADVQQDLESVAPTLPAGFPSSWLVRQPAVLGLFARFIEEYSAPPLDSLQPGLAFELRYRQRHYVPTPSEPFFERRFTFRGVTGEDRVILEQEVNRRTKRCDHTHIIGEAMKLIPKPQQQFGTIHLDCYAELSDDGLGSFSYDAEGVLPVGYTATFQKIEDASLVYLKDGHSRFTFRLFILGHGDKEQDRADMVPIYSVTCGMQGTDPATRRTMVYQRSIDEDFAKCRMNGGCRRCRSTE